MNTPEESKIELLNEVKVETEILTPTHKKRILLDHKITTAEVNLGDAL